VLGIMVAGGCSRTESLFSLARSLKLFIYLAPCLVSLIHVVKDIHVMDTMEQTLLVLMCLDFSIQSEEGDKVGK
jgi:hypothetical protein